jgi:hypothetical protein
MDDLNGLDWSSGPKDPGKPPPMSSSSLFTSMRASPVSGRSTTPLSTASSIPASNNPKPPSKPATPANDSFANLVSFGGTSGASNSNLSLLEKQKLLQEQKARQEAEKRNRFEAQYGGQNAQFWDSLDHVPKQPAAPRSATSTPAAAAAADDDFLAAFDASAPVDASTNFPVPSSSTTPALSTKTSTPEATSALNLGDDDDDPFGLGQLPSKSTTARPPPVEHNDDDDFLGLLGKPVSELPQPQKQPEPQVSPELSKSDDPRDRAIAELVDMGFPLEKAAQALESTESGVDVQAAVGWLLNQAHSESRQKTRAKSGLPPEESQPRSKRQNGAPSWMKDDDSQGRRADSRLPASRDRDVGEMASKFGNQLFKTANTLWKTGSKKVQQAVHELNAEADPNRPRWMQEASLADEDNGRVSQPPRASKPLERDEPQRPGNVTDEALLLESGSGRPASRKPKPADTRSPQYPGRLNEIHMEDRESRPQPPLREQREPRQQVQQQRRPQQPNRDVKSHLNRGALEEQSAQAYVSPARRRRTPQPPKEEPAVDLFESPKPVAPTPSSFGAARPAPKPKSPAPLPSRPKTVARSVPNVSPSALASFHKDRENGNEAYKRGDYAAAHESFTRSLSHLPGNHPVTILALSNRAMTALKIGEPKVAVSDSESVLTFIGPSKGEGESVELGNGQPAKPMRDFFGKAIMRKAEGLEHLEKWVEAAQVWRQAVESGHGGGASIQGRNRCEKAAGISKPSTPAAGASRSATPRSAPAAVKKATPRTTTPSNTAPTGEAVSRLRAANEAADRADEEKLALTDSVDARLAAWKDGKQDNLRALLGSLDNVLWPEAGWKKVGLAELVLPNKVKIQYMKGIAKVHPDKVRLLISREIGLFTNKC